MRIKQILTLATILASIPALSSTGQAHFGVIVPSDDIISQDDSKKLHLKLQFLAVILADDIVRWNNHTKMGLSC